MFANVFSGLCDSSLARIVPVTNKSAPIGGSLCLHHLALDTAKQQCKSVSIVVRGTL